MISFLCEHGKCSNDFRCVNNYNEDNCPIGSGNWPCSGLVGSRPLGIGSHSTNAGGTTRWKSRWWEQHSLAAVPCYLRATASEAWGYPGNVSSVLRGPFCEPQNVGFS